MPDLTYQRACGIDVAKDTLEVHLADGERRKSLSTTNDRQGFEKIMKLCREHQIQIIVMEATGGYERELAHALVAEDLPVAVINPGRIRHHALGEGVIAKTDKVDARVITSFALKIAPACSSLRTRAQDELVALVARKAQLVDCKVAEDNRLQQQSNPFLSKGIERHLKWIAKEIRKIEDRLDELVRLDPVLQCKAEAADTVKGIGRDSAVALVSLMPELGEMTRRETAALAGLAPKNNESGKLSGERHIYGGRPAVRTVLYMCTLSAIRSEGVLRDFYQRLVGEGKNKMKAITAAMRKMLVIVNARIRDALAALTPPQAKAAAAIAAGG